MLGLPGAQLLRRYRIGKRAPGGDVRNQDRAVGAEDLGGLRHEVDAAHDDDVGVGLRRRLGEAEGVANEIRDVLNRGHLVVVGQNDGVSPRAEVADLLDDLVGRRGVDAQLLDVFKEADGCHFWSFRAEIVCAVSRIWAEGRPRASVNFDPSEQKYSK